MTFTVAAGSAGICTLSGSSVTFVSAGTCTINANQSGNATYQAAPQVQQSFAISAASSSTQSINFTSSAPAGASIERPDTTSVTASASSRARGHLHDRDRQRRDLHDLRLTVSFVGAGTCTINANQAGNAAARPRRR